jgi:hypothetical protein
MIHKIGKVVSREIFEFFPDTVFHNYFNWAGYVDQVNDEVLQYFPIVRQHRWKVKVLWMFIFTMFHNARMMWNLVHEEPKSGIQWRIELCDILSGSFDFKTDHKVEFDFLLFILEV